MVSLENSSASRRQGSFLLLGAVLLTFGAQLALWLSLPHDSFWVVDPGAKFLQVRNFTWESRAIEYPGRDLDPELRFAPFFPAFIFQYEGEFYGTYNPLFIGLSALFYHLFGFSGLYLLPLFSSLGVLLVTAALTSELSPRWRIAAPIVVGLASPLVFYAFAFWEHELGVLLATLGLLLLYRAVEQDKVGWPVYLAGVSCGVGLAVRSELAVWSAAMLVSLFLIWRRERKVLRPALSFIAGVVSMMVLFQLYEWYEYGALTKANIAANYLFLGTAAGWQELLASRIDIALVWLTPTNLWVFLWLGALALLALRKAVPSDGARRASTVAALGLVFVGLGLMIFNLATYDIFEDVLQTFPLLLCGVFLVVAPRLPFSPAEGRLVRFILYTSGIFGAVALATAFNAGGAQWGPRYLLPIFPGLTAVLLGMVARLDRERLGRPLTAAARLALAGAVAVGIATQLAGVEQLAQRKRDQGEMIRQIRALPEQILLVDNPFSALGFAPAFYDKTMLQVSRQEDVAPFLETLRSHGVRNFAFASVSIDGVDFGTEPIDLDEGPCCVELERVADTAFPIEMRPQNLRTLRMGLGLQRVDTYLRLRIAHYALADPPATDPS